MLPSSVPPTASLKLLLLSPGAPLISIYRRHECPFSILAFQLHFERGDDLLRLCHLNFLLVYGEEAVDVFPLRLVCRPDDAALVATLLATVQRLLALRLPALVQKRGDTGAHGHTHDGINRVLGGSNSNR